MRSSRQWIISFRLTVFNRMECRREVWMLSRPLRWEKAEKCQWKDKQVDGKQIEVRYNIFQTSPWERTEEIWAMKNFSYCTSWITIKKHTHSLQKTIKDHLIKQLTLWMCWKGVSTSWWPCRCETPLPDSCRRAAHRPSSPPREGSPVWSPLYPHPSSWSQMPARSYRM